MMTIGFYRDENGYISYSMETGKEQLFVQWIQLRRQQKCTLIDKFEDYQFIFFQEKVVFLCVVIIHILSMILYVQICTIDYK